MNPFISPKTSLLTIHEIDLNRDFGITIDQLKALSHQLSNLANNLEQPSEKRITLQDSLKDTGQLMAQLKAIKTTLENALSECKKRLEKQNSPDIYRPRWLITWQKHTLTSLFFDHVLPPLEQNEEITRVKGYHARYEVIHAQLVNNIDQFNTLHRSLENIMGLNLQDTIGLSIIEESTSRTNHVSPRGS